MNFLDPYCIYNLNYRRFQLTAEFGTDHIYNSDTFNEMPPHTSNVTYLADVSRNTFLAITDVDPSAVW
jgi:alpha-N-acetylglucosaminidase